MKGYYGYVAMIYGNFHIITVHFHNFLDTSKHSAFKGFVLLSTVPGCPLFKFSKLGAVCMERD